MRTNPTALRTNITTSDSTVDRESSFSDDSARMDVLFEASHAQQQNLWLLNKILVGTSSEESDAALEGVARGLLQRGHIGVVASHSRGKNLLEEELPGFKNFHVTDLDDPEHKYAIEPGPSTRRNAFAIMSNEGIPQDIVKASINTFELDNPDLELDK